MDRPLPVPTPVSKPFWDGLRDRRIVIQYSPSSDAWNFYPRVLAAGTLADDLEWREVPGRGRVYTFTVARRPTAPPWADSLPQILAVVELDEGPRISTELVNVDPEKVFVGMRLRPVFCPTSDDEVVLLRFEPSEPAHDPEVN